MRVSDIQMMLVVRGLYREGHRSIEGEKTKHGVFQLKSKVHLWDYTDSQVFRDKRLYAALGVM